MDPVSPYGRPPSYHPSQNGQRPAAYPPPQNGQRPSAYPPPQNGQRPPAYHPAQPGQRPPSYQPPQGHPRPAAPATPWPPPQHYGGGPSQAGASYPGHDVMHQPSREADRPTYVFPPGMSPVSFGPEARPYYDHGPMVYARNDPFERFPATTHYVPGSHAPPPPRYSESFGDFRYPRADD